LVLLYFIYDVDKILAQICGSFASIDLWKRLAGYGPQKIADNMNQHLNRWKTEKVRFAVVGRSATGKSTFINKLRGVKEGQQGFAGVGFGNKGQKITEYKHPVNENIIVCDVPGLSMKFNKLKFQKLVNLTSYPAADSSNN
jgi:ribosome biogenesis GTPase A